MKFTILFLSFFIHFIISFGQAELRGIITIQNSKGKAAYPAQIKAFGATETATNSDGSFKLKFGRKKSGEDVSIEVVKDGYEVVNKRDLFTRLPEKAKDQELHLYMCVVGTWQKNALKYFGINEKVIAKKFEQKIETLEARLNQQEIESDYYKLSVAKLNKQREAALNQANELAEKFSKANLDVESKRYNKAFQLFTKGKIDSVIIVLNEEDILKEVEIAKKTLDRAVKEFLLKAEAHIINFDWKNAEKTFRHAIATKPDDFHANNDFAYFLQDQSKYKEALTFYEKAKDIGLQQNFNKLRYNILLNDLARFYSWYGLIEKSNETFEMAIKSWKNLLKQDNTQKRKAVLLIGYSACLENYGGLLIDGGKTNEELDKGIEVLTTALSTHMEFVKLSKQINRNLDKDYEMISVANINNLLSLAWKYKLDVKQSELYIKKAVIIADSIEVNKEDDLFVKSLIYMNYGNLLKWGTRLWEDVAVKEAEGEPEQFLDGNARSIPYYEKSINILKPLYEQNPNRYRNDLAKLYKNIALAWEVEDLDKAAPYYIDAIEIYGKLYEYDPEFYLTRYIDLFRNFSNRFYYAVRIPMMKYEEEEVSQESLNEIISYIAENIHNTISIQNLLFSEVNRFFPDICESDKASVLDGQIAYLNLYKQPLQDFYAETKNIDLLPIIADINDAIGVFECDNVEKIKLLYEESELLENYLKMMPNSTKSKRLSSIYGNLSWYLIFEKRYKEAEVAAKNGLKADPKALWINTNLAHAYLFQNKEEKAATVYLYLKGKPYIKNKNFTQVLLEDLKLLKEKGFESSKIEKIIKLLSK